MLNLFQHPPKYTNAMLKQVQHDEKNIQLS